MAEDEKTTNLPKEEKHEEKVDINSLLDNEVAIEKPAKDAEDYAVAIENARLAFQKKFKAGRRNSYIMMALVLIIAIVSVVFITMKAPGFKIAGWVLIGVAVVGMLTYYIVTRNTMPHATKEYIAVVNKELNTRNFADPRFTDARTDKDEKLELSDPISDAIYKDLNNIASRNVINGQFQGRSFMIGDMGLYSGSGRSRTSNFVGKYISYPNDLHFESRYIITISGATPVDLPTDIDDLVKIVEEEGFVIYGKEGSKPASDLGKAFMEKVKNLKAEKPLLNLNLVIWGGHSSAYASYEDVIMTLPFEKPFDKTPNETYVRQLLAIMEAFQLLLKKEK